QFKNNTLASFYTEMAMFRCKKTTTVKR
ncbi:SAM-dependent methyltransferase, partial [Bacillus cereus]|nr:SAM-dependent methyltransferase [Bacillus cereus]